MSAKRKEDKFRPFGQTLKQIRVNDANIGLRKFAEMIGMQPSNLSDIERSKKAPPADKKKLDMICDTLGLSKTDPRRAKLFDLAANYNSKRIPADVADAIRSQPGVPVLVRTIANKQLSESKLRQLAAFIQANY